MWKLDPPVHTAQEAYEVSVSRVRNAGLSTRLTAATASVVAASDQLDLAIQAEQVHLILPHDLVNNDITAAEMEKVYTQRMAKTGAPGRAIYDAIFASPPQGRCPLCTQRSVTTLDHYLPKKLFPSLAVAPLNLVPACSDCNKLKLDSAPTSASDVPLHPYYDDLGDERWLKGTVVECTPAAVKFSVVAPTGWDGVLASRVKHHFKELGLAMLFASEAAEELINIRHQLTLLETVDPQDGVRNELGRRAASCAATRSNGWRAATYRAWHESDWFCDGGFRLA